MRIYILLILLFLVSCKSDNGCKGMANNLEKNAFGKKCSVETTPAPAVPTATPSPTPTFTNFTDLSGVAASATVSYGVAVDSQNNSWIVGYTAGNLDGETKSGNTDMFIIKYNSSGVKQWTKLLGAAGGGVQANGVVVDSSGNAYAVGQTDRGLNGETLTGTTDAFIAKYNTSGNLQWVKLAGVAGVATLGKGIDIDSSINLYITGNTSGNLHGEILTGSGDAFIVKYNSSGTRQWTKLHGVAANGTVGRGIKVDSSGNIFITGITNGPLGGESEIGVTDSFVAKFNSTPTHQWTTLFGANGANTQATGVDIDSSSNAYIAGMAYADLNGETCAGCTTGHSDSYLVKLNSSGVIQWTELSGVANSTTNAYAVATNSSGTSWLVGAAYGNIDGQTKTGTIDIHAIKYDSSGVKLGTILNGVAGGNSFGKAVTLNSSDKIFVSGETDGNLNGETKSGAYDAYVTTGMN